MSQVQSLLDMFLNNRKDVQGKSAKAPEAKHQTDGAKGDLLPIGDAAKAKGASKSFQSRIKESHAKLEAKAAQPAQAHRNPAAKPAHEASTEQELPRAEAARPARDSHSAKTERPDRSETARPHSRKATRRDDARDANTMESGEIESDSRTAPLRAQLPADGANDASAPAPLDAEAMKELKAGLESIGIHASEEQLLDPAFLSGILQMLQALPMPSVTDAGLETAPEIDLEISALGSGTAPIAPVQQDAEAQSEAAPAPIATASAATTIDPELAAAIANAQPAESDRESAPVTVLPEENAQPAASEGKAPSRQELTALIKNQLDALESQASEASKNASAAATAATSSPTTTPAGWEGIKVRPRAESVSTQPLPMADLDRLRVLQSAAFQAGNAGKEIQAAPLSEGSDDIASMDAIGETGNAVTASDLNPDAADQRAFSDGDAEFTGNDGNAFTGAEAAARKDGAPAAKDGANGIPFQANLEQTHSVEHRAGTQRAWEPRPAFEPSAVEQLAKKMSVIGHKNGEEMSIQLSPEHLGKVRVSLEMKDGAMTARIAVENENVRKQVEEGLASLKDAMENQGIKLQGLEVSVDQRQSSLFNPDGSNAESFFHRNHKGSQGGSNGAGEIAPFESAPESDTGRRLGYNTMEYIG